ncbi:hypothetical protein ACGC1H_005498 [Rhizoctonia solani]
MSIPNLVRSSGTGQPFWPPVHRVEKGYHKTYPAYACLVITLPVFSSSDMEARQQLVDEIHCAAKDGVVSSNEKVVHEAGWVTPGPGELVLARLEGDKTDGERDTVIGIALTTDYLPHGDRKLKKIQDDLLGPRESRMGTAAIEKSPNSSHAGHQGPRCYTVGASIETGTNRMGPAANITPGQATSDQYWKTLSRVVPSMADLHSEAIASVISPEDAAQLAKRGEYFNAPALGNTRRHLVTGMQVNVTGVSGSARKSHSALGSAALFHTDDGDDFCTLSALTNLSDVGSDFDLGFFFLLEYGIAFEWKPFLTVLSSARALHVSSPPQLRSLESDRQPEPWELRLLVISYPSLDVLTRTGPTLLASGPGGPHLTHPQYENSHTTSTHAYRTWASAGRSLMSRENLVIFLARELLSLGQRILSQDPELAAHACIDVQNFLASFQFDSQNGHPQRSADMNSVDGEISRWQPAISHPNCTWKHSPWSGGQSWFTRRSPPDLVDLTEKRQAVFPVLSARQQGIKPSHSAHIQVALSQQSNGKRVGSSSQQKAVGKCCLLCIYA